MDALAMNTDGSPKNRPRLGPHSRAIERGAIGWAIDGRSREGRFLRAYEAMLIKHLGGKPSAVHLEVVRRAARLALHLELQDEKTLGGEAMSDGGAKWYMTWHNSLCRTLGQIGFHPVKAPTLTLQEYLDSKASDAA